MNKIIFSILIVFISLAIVRAQEKPKAFVFFECEKISSNLLKEKVDEFYKKLKNNKDSQGYIINYGTAKKSQNVKNWFEIR